MENRGKNRVRRIAAFARALLALFVVATTMAVSCPSPDDPDTVNPGNEGQTKSAERTKFEKSRTEGLHVKGECIIAYSDEYFQTATNLLRRSYRIHADDQSCFVNVVFADRVPTKIDDEVVVNITYKTEGSGETMLIVKFVTVAMRDGYLWLWNELQKVGLIVPAI